MAAMHARASCCPVEEHRGAARFEAAGNFMSGAVILKTTPVGDSGRGNESRSWPVIQRKAISTRAAGLRSDERRHRYRLVDYDCGRDWLWRHVLVGDVGSALPPPPLTRGGARNGSPANGLKESARRCEAVPICNLEHSYFGRRCRKPPRKLMPGVLSSAARPITGAFNAAS